MSGLAVLMGFGALCWCVYLGVQVLDLKRELALNRKVLERIRQRRVA